MAKRKTILGIHKCGQQTSCAPYAPLGCSVFYSPCCKSEVVVSGNGSTHWHSCARCGVPCDPIQTNASRIMDNLSNAENWVKHGDFANAFIRVQEAYNAIRVIYFRKQNASGEGRAIARTLDPIVGSSGGDE
ncbi:MAG: hypothetical protein PHW65_00190 [Dehalococcoidales bacterium]|nr:hypothetical protein [Dehalococcoidales bacterium]